MDRVDDVPVIQIVDDDRFFLKLLANMLASLGLSSVKTCADAQRAINDFTAGAPYPDLILLDLNMPDMDGLAFIRGLAELDYQGAVLLISGEEESIVQSSVKLAQAHGIQFLGQLHKPVQLPQLAGLINRWLTERKLATPGQPKSPGNGYTAAELQAALLNGELINYYQPKVNVVSGQVQGVEALVRWQHPCDGIVAPDRFIPLAENHGLIDALTRQVLDNVLSDIKHWRSEGVQLKVAINLSMENLVSIGFMESICSNVIAAGVRPEEISFEVTESRLLADARAPLEILTRLRLQHFDLALDDFGTGFATFSQLVDFPFTQLKVDQRFVHGGATETGVRNFYHASLRLARAFGLDVVAEGVEDRADWDFVQASGDLCAQGYFVARPMAARSIKSWLDEWQDRLEKERLLPQARGEYVI